METSSKSSCPSAEELIKIHKDHVSFEKLRTELFDNLRTIAKNSKHFVWFIPEHISSDSIDSLKKELESKGMDVVLSVEKTAWKITWPLDKKQEKKIKEKVDTELVGHDEDLAASQYDAVFNKLLVQLTECKQKGQVNRLEWEFPDGWWETSALYKLKYELDRLGFPSKYKTDGDERDMRQAVFIFTWKLPPTPISSVATQSWSHGTCAGYGGKCGSSASPDSAYCYECRGL